MGLTCSPLHFGFPATFRSALPRWRSAVPEHLAASSGPAPAVFRSLRPYRQPGSFSLPRRPHQSPACLLFKSRPPSVSPCRPIRPGDSLPLPAFQLHPNTPARLTHLSGTTRQNVSPVTTKTLQCQRISDTCFKNCCRICPARIAMQETLITGPSVEARSIRLSRYLLNLTNGVLGSSIMPDNFRVYIDNSTLGHFQRLYPRLPESYKGNILHTIRRF